jgi:hypothetical protein
MDASSEELALARETLDEPEWTHGRPVAEPVDPREVPELGTFFFRKRAAAVHLGVFCLTLVVAFGIGAARAIADVWNEPIAKDPSPVEQKRLPVQAESAASHVETPTAR